MLRALLRALALCTSIAAVDAQSVVHLPVDEGAAGKRELQVSIAGVAASARPGGQGHVRVDVSNPGTLTHRVTIRVADFTFDQFVATRVVELEPGGRSRVFLPLPPMVYQAQVRLGADGGELIHGANLTTTADQRQGISLLVVGDAQTDTLGWQGVITRRLQAMPSASSSTVPLEVSLFEALLPADLPPDWTLLDGFDLVVVDGRANGLDAAVQRVLRDYLRAGGRVLVSAFDRLPAGPLHDAVDADGVARGFGLALGITGSGLPAEALAAADEQALSDWLLRGDGALEAATRPTSGPLPPSMFEALVVDGLGDVPVRTFFVIILLFAIVVGPVNWLWFRRRRMLPLLLLTVPICGLLTTGAMLGYGILAEGLGIRGTLRSFTILDQATHEAVAWSSRTLYAGLSPSRLVPEPATRVATLASGSPWRARSESRFVSLPDGTIDGAVLPSRTPTTLGVVNLGPARERLRFERGTDGTLTVLASADFAPGDGAGTIVMRDFDGGYWLRSASGAMQACSVVDALETVARLVDATLGGVDFDAPWSNALPLGSAWSQQGPASRFLGVAGTAALPPGHYLMQPGPPGPSVDDLGLAGDILRRELVLGRLAKEDIVD